MTPLSHHIPDVVDRARAAFVGLAVGDALGATVEFMTASEIRASLGVHREVRGGGWLRLRPGAVTDDTEMSLAAARSLAAEGRFVPRAVADALVAWLRSRPADVGNTCRRGLRRYILDGSLEGPSSQGDAGNGAAMRVLPFAIATLASRASLERDAVLQAHLTHHHPLSDAACVLVGRVVHRACLGLSMGQLRSVADEAAARVPGLRFVPYPGLSTAYVGDTLPTVLHHLFSTASFEECLVGIVNQGGDADTTGAIAGAIAGAYYGPDAIPRRWVAKLDGHLVAELEALAKRLVALSPLARGEAPDL
ncbi:MAG TPA: ADP-ribosyl-[dinitrogen reductase] hydrolase [Anaeromyxobacteraceae bacterium]|nr:ADP-ribosyl-[dinitrogen reductase] hydrolase [Anaeromyxobacteraceae bacterium]